MSDFTEAFLGALGLFVGGIVLVAVAPALPSSGIINLGAWGGLYAFVGAVLAVVVVVIAVRAAVGSI